MDQLRNFLLLQRIYSRSTIMQMAINYVLLLYGAFLYRIFILIYGDTHALRPWIVLIWLACPIASYLFVRAIVRYLICSEALAAQFDTEEHAIDTKITNSSMSYELDGVDHLNMLAGVAGSWEVYTAVFDIYRTTKYGKYRAKEAFYTVFEGVLRRSVPHLILDSKRAKGRQYKKLYLQSQRLTLEGGFSKYFDVYSPEHYQIDTLSFITPDVMEALVALQDYDIEIVDDRILCAGPLLTESKQQELRQKSLVLVGELNHNLKTYRDTRLSKKLGKSSVTPFARALLKNPRKYLPRLILATVLLVGLLYLYTNVPAAHIHIVVLLIAGLEFTLRAHPYYDILIKNRRLEADFKKHYQS